jgi:hypothetical protein
VFRFNRRSIILEVARASLPFDLQGRVSFLFPCSYLYSNFISLTLTLTTATIYHYIDS